MRSWLLAAVLTLVAAAPSGVRADSCGRFDTAVDFVSTPSEAARLAKDQTKLVFVLHVSGFFEDPALT